MLRREDEELALAPQPSLAPRRLAGPARAAPPACPSTCASRATRVPLPAGIDLTAYRLIQEALRRAHEHGGAGRAQRRPRLRRRRVRIEVTDDGGAEGRRLLGLRERVSVYGGELQGGRAGAAAAGACAARLPVGASQ